MIVTLPADPDLYERELLEALLTPLVEAETAIVDLREAPYVTSAVMSALVLLKRRRARDAAPVTLLCTSPFVRRILAAVEFDREFPVYDSDEAVAS